MGTTFSDRKELILAALAEDSNVSVADLAKRMGVSVVTVRTDLASLEVTCPRVWIQFLS